MAKYDLHNKNILISGASSGIGRQLAIILSAQYGCRVFGIARNAEKLEKVKMETGGAMLYETADVSKKESWERLAKALENRGFYPDVIINNAGIIHPFDSFFNLSDGEIESVINTNYKSLIYSSRAMLPLLEKSGSPAIINVISAAATLPLAGTSVYSSSKRAALSFTEAVSQELSCRGVYVAAVLPGPVKTDLYKTRQAEGENRIKIKESLISEIGLSAKAEAQKIIRGISRRKKRIVTGIISKAMYACYNTAPSASVTAAGFIMRHLPLKTFRAIFKKESSQAKQPEKKDMLSGGKGI